MLVRARSGLGFGVLAIVALLAARAEASTIVVLSEPARSAELGSALQVTLAGRGVAVATLPAPDGALRLDRAAAAQRAAISTGADIALWIDADAQAVDVCAVSSDGRYFRHAPLPVDGATPRVFAAIATSLVDEMIAPPDAPAIDVDVHVHVGPDGAVAAAPTAMIAPPGFAAVAPAALAVAESAVPVRADRVLFEVGPMLSPLTFGIEAELTFPVSDHVRLGAIGIADITFVDETIPIFGAAAELRYVGSGSRHWDIGAIAGAAEGDGDAVGFGGVRLSRAWEGAQRGTAFSITPLLVSDGAETFPGLYAALHWALPL